MQFVFKKLTHYFIYFCIGFFIFVAIGELSLRTNSKFRLKKKHVEWVRSMMAYDELLGWRLVPNSRAWSESPEYKVQYIINSKGLRDKEYSYNKEPGKLRIIYLGDSITFGWGVDANSRFTEILERRFTNVEIINMGVPGYGIDQDLLFLNQEGVKYLPDLVLIYVIPDDLKRACYSKMWGRPKPKFLLGKGDRLILSNVPVPRMDIFSFNHYMLDQIRCYLAQKSYLFYFIQHKFYLWNESRVKGSGNEAIKEELAKAVFKEMCNRVKLLNAKMITVGNLSDNIQKFLRENNIYFCEDPLLTYSGNPSEIYYTEFHHPNAFGHKLIAEGIYKYCIENRLVPEGMLEYARTTHGKHKWH